MSILITGISGQDGGYLAEQLSEAGSPLAGLIEPGAELPASIEALRQSGQLQLHTCDLADHASFRQLLRDLEPEKVFHLAAVSQPQDCDVDPLGSAAINVASAEVLVEWVRRDQPSSRALLVSSAWVFGSPDNLIQTENSPARPPNEYARQKQQIRELAKAARAEGLFVSCTIPYSHESPRRPESFVVAKVVNTLARIKLGSDEPLTLGPVTARRDWGYAPEYTQAMAWMLDVDKPLELILATGEANSIDQLVDAACACFELERDRHVHSGSAQDDKPQVAQCGDASRAWEELAWEASTKFAQLIPLLCSAAVLRFK